MHLDYVGASATKGCCPPEYFVTLQLKGVRQYPIENVHACDCFLNNSRTERDEGLQFSLDECCRASVH